MLATDVGVSMGHQATDLGVFEEVARDPAEEPFPEAAVAEGAAHDQVCPGLLCDFHDGGSCPGAISGSLNASSVDIVQGKMGDHVIEFGTVGGVRDLDHLNLVGELQKGHRIRNRPTTLKGILPGDHDTRSREPIRAGWHHEHGPSQRHQCVSRADCGDGRA